MGDLLKKVMENPELLSGAMSMASALASSGALNSLLGKKPEEKKEEDDRTLNSQNPLSGLSGISGLSGLSGLMSALAGGPHNPPPESEEKPDAPPEPRTPRAIQADHGPRRAGHKERIALLEAMRPFISPEKKDRLELLIRLLGVMEIAEGMGFGR